MSDLSVVSGQEIKKNENIYEEPGESKRETVLFEETPPSRILLRQEAEQRLNLIGKTEAYNSYAYIKISATNMNLTNINIIGEFKYLLFIDVSGNKLRIEDLHILTMMKFVILIQADRNIIKSASLDQMAYLQVLLLNENSIANCRGIQQPLLSTLEMRRNKITAIDFEYHLHELRILDLSYNTILSVQGMEFTSLDTLYLAANQIVSLSGIETLKNLRILHLRSNPIEELTYLDETLEKLQYLNLRSCKIDMLNEFKKLQMLPALEIIVVTGCPLMEGMEEEEASMLRIELTAFLKKLKRVNKEEITEDDREAAKEIRREWEDYDEK